MNIDEIDIYDYFHKGFENDLVWSFKQNEKKGFRIRNFAELGKNTKR